MKNKIFLTAVIACAFMFINCSDNTNKETTKTTGDNEARIETVMTVSPSTTPEYKHKGSPKAPDNRGAVKYLAASSKPSPSFSTADVKFTKELGKQFSEEGAENLLRDFPKVPQVQQELATVWQDCSEVLLPCSPPALQKRTPRNQQS